MKTKLLVILCTLAFTFTNLLALSSHSYDFSNSNKNATPYEGAVEALILVDAETGEDLFVLDDGAALNIADIEGRKLSIRVKTIWSDDPENAVFFTDIKIDFRLEGPLNFSWTEGVVPYALFGDINGSYNGKEFPEGNYSIWVGVDDSPDGLSYWDTLKINFSIGNVEHYFTAFHLINPELDFISWRVDDGTTINYANNPVSFEARPGTYKIGSVVLELSGPISYSATENFAPFTLFGDSGGNFAGKVLPEGDYTLTATPYSESHEKGKTGVPLTIHFKVEFDKEAFDLSTFINMVDAASGEHLETIFVFDKKTIDKKNIPTDNVNFVVYPNTPAIRSVYMALQGPVDSFENFVPPSHIQIENIAPHSMFGDLDGVFNGKSLQPGMYRITATPYSGENGTGNGGFGRRFDFEIIDSSTFLKTPLLAEGGEEIILFPNPSKNSITLKSNDEVKLQKVSVLNIFGQEVRSYDSLVNSNQIMDVSGLPNGLYFVQIATEKGKITKKLLVQ